MLTRFRVAVSFLLVVAVALVTSTANAAPILFIGSDNGANSSDPRPNSNAAAASFDAAAAVLGSVQIATFESSPLGGFTSVSIAPGVSLTGANISGANQNIVNTPVGTPDGLFGYNTTSGGANFASAFGGSLTVSFATPTNAFGGYLSGLQLAGETITFNDGSPQTVNIPTLGSGIAFVGFTNANLFSSLTINVTNDIVGLDDVRTLSSLSEPVSPVPEPVTMILLGTSLVGAAVMGRRRRTAA